MTQLKFANEKYGKWALVGGGVLIWLVILVLFKFYGYEKTWQLWKVPTEMPPFLDFRLIPGSAESFQRGFEPTVENPNDPRSRIFNYPMFWRLFFYIKLTESQIIWIGISMIVLFFMGAFLFPQKLTVFDSLWMLLVLFSPASMLLYERGNVDLVIFFVCVFVILVEGYSAYVAAALLVVGGVMKLYPVLGVSVLLRESKSKFIWLTAICFFMLIAYVYLTFDSVRASWDLTMRGIQISYGTNVLFSRYEQNISLFLAQWFSAVQVETISKTIPLILGGILVLVSGVMGIRDQEPLTVSSERNLAAFRMGASIYVGTFLLRNNWDYRLAFLVLVIPQLSYWMRSLNNKKRKIVLMGVVLVLASCWHFMIWYSPYIRNFKDIMFILDELLNWSLVYVFTYLLFATAPEWLKSGSRHILMFDRRKPA